MRVRGIFAGVAAVVLAAGSALAEDVVAAFIGDAVTVYDDAAAVDGRSVAACAFVLPAEVLEGSQLLRVRIEGPEGPVWISSSEVIVAGLDELPQPRTIGAGDAMAGGTRTPEPASEVPTDGRSLPAEGVAATAEESVAEPATSAGSALCPESDEPVD